MGGVVADRLDKRPIIMATGVVLAVLIGVLPFTRLEGRDPMLGIVKSARVTPEATMIATVAHSGI